MQHKSPPPRPEGAVEYKTYEELKAEFAKFKHPHYEAKLLSEIPTPTLDSFMCHLYNASYVTLFMHENKRIAAKPLPARSRDIKSVKEKKEGKEKDATDSIYKQIPKPQKEGSEKAPKENAVLSMRYIAKKLGSKTGEVANGDELCAIVNAVKEYDPEQKYSAKSVRAASKAEYVKTIIDAIDSGSPPIVAYDYVWATEIEERKGEREHSTVVVGYIQENGAAPKTQFVLLGAEGYCIVSADKLYASTSQLESRLYSKEKSDLELENRGRIAPMEDIRRVDAELKQEFKDCNAIKVQNTDRTAWWPVTKAANFLVRKFISLPASDRRTVPVRDEKGWQNTVVVIQPDEPKGPRPGGR